MARAKNQPVRQGDLLWVPVCLDRYAVGIVLHLSNYIRNGMVVGFFPQTFRTQAEVDPSSLRPPFIETPQWTSKLLVADGHWKVIGNLHSLVTTLPPFVFRIGSDLFQNDENIGRVDREHWNEYPEVLGWGVKAIEARLRQLLCPTLSV